MGVLLQGFYKLPPNDALPSPADGKPGIPWWWDHIAAQARAFSLAGFTAIWLPPVLKTHPARRPGPMATARSTTTTLVRKSRKARFRHALGRAKIYSAAPRFCGRMDSTSIWIWWSTTAPAMAPTRPRPLFSAISARTARPGSAAFPRIRTISFLRYRAIPIWGAACGRFSFGRELAQSMGSRRIMCSTT